MFKYGKTVVYSFFTEICKTPPNFAIPIFLLPRDPLHFWLWSSFIFSDRIIYIYIEAEGIEINSKRGLVMMDTYCVFLLMLTIPWESVGDPVYTPKTSIVLRAAGVVVKPVMVITIDKGKGACHNTSLRRMCRIPVCLDELRRLAGSALKKGNCMPSNIIIREKLSTLPHPKPSGMCHRCQIESHQTTYFPFP